MNLRYYLCIITIFTAGHSENVNFPMWPYAFVYSDAEVIGIGDVSLFVKGPLATFHNPANNDSSIVFSISVMYDAPTSDTGSHWGGDDIGFSPQSIGAIYPGVGKGNLGILFQKLMKWQGTYMNTDTIIGNSSLSNIALGYSYPISLEMNMGIAAYITLGTSKFSWNLNNIEATSEYNAYGIGLVASNSLKLKNTIFALRYLTPTYLRGNELFQMSNSSTTNTIRDKIPWEINGGIKQLLSSSVICAVQITYKNWQRFEGDFAWGDHEWQIKGGLGFRPFEHLDVKLGSFMQQFYQSADLPIITKGDANVIFLTGSVCFETRFIKTAIGLGKTVFIEHSSLSFYPKRFLISLNFSMFP